MPNVAVGLANSIGTLMHRLPSWRDLPGLRSKSAPHSPVVLASLIEGEIIPRLLVAHRPVHAAPVRNGAAEAAIDASAPEIFAPMTLDRDVFALLEHIDGFTGRGVSIETVLIELIAPTARMLGNYWEEDQCDFVDVTMGLWRLQEVVHELVARLPLAVAADGRRALFTIFPGDQHSFGLMLVDEFFRMGGWDTHCFTEGSQADLTALVRRDWFDLVGMTITREEDVERAPALIATLRNASRNRALGVWGGGGLRAQQRVGAFMGGAEGTAADARQAVARAAVLVDASTDAQSLRC